MTGSVNGSAQRILRLGNAFCEAQSLLTAVELDIFGALHGSPATEEEIRDRLNLHGRGLRDFLWLLVQLDLLAKADGRYRNTADADRHLVAGQPDYLGGFLRGVKANLYQVWDGLSETLRTGKPQAASDDFASMLDDPQQLRRYAGMMDGINQPLVPRLIAAVDWAKFRSVVDVGGCRGSLVGQVVTEHPHLCGKVFDLPPMERAFDERMAELGTTGKVRFHAGDFFRDPLPLADVVILGHVLHNWQRAQREQLMRKAFRAVNPGGLLVVHDRMLDDDRPRMDNLVASLIMALVTEEGAEYPISELVELAEAVGFTSVSHQALDDNETLVLCRKARAL
jgi:SAM-dependent methyltransferase